MTKEEGPSESSGKKEGKGKEARVRSRSCMGRREDNKKMGKVEKGEKRREREPPRQGLFPNFLFFLFLGKARGGGYGTQSLSEINK